MPRKSSKKPLAVTMESAEHNVPPFPETKHATLIEFRHGLGDLVQLSVVLRHLRKANPGLDIDVVCANGMQRSSSGAERQRFAFQDKRYRPHLYSQVLSLDFGECSSDVLGLPSSKPWRCLCEVLRLEPTPELFTYSVEVGAVALSRAARYLGEISGTGPGPDGRYPVVLLHYQGTSSRMQKDLPHETAGELVRVIRSAGRAVALFDFDRQSPLVDQSTVHSPLRGHPVWQELTTPDPETMTAMISLCECFLGVDSGPLHLAGATATPTLGVWTHHHPTRYYDFAPNVMHLVPVGHRRFAPGRNAIATFHERYRSTTYGDVTSACIEQLKAILDGNGDLRQPVSAVVPGLQATGYDEQYYTEHVLGGLDYLGHGDWQREYGLWLADALGWRGKRVLDVGCACGSIMRGLGEAGAIVQGFDVSEYMINRGRQNWPDMASLLHTCDAVNLHLFKDESWFALHSNQVAEHWRPELVPFILRELLRITCRGGLFFCVLDTTELFDRNKRAMENEDKTHICIRPLQWWYDQLSDAGWEVCTADVDGELRKHPKSYFNRYDWDYFAARRPIGE